MLTLWGPQELPCDNVALLAFAYNGVGYFDLDSILTDAPTFLKCVLPSYIEGNARMSYKGETEFCGIVICGDACMLMITYFRTAFAKISTDS